MKTLRRSLAALALIPVFAAPLLADPLGIVVVGNYAYVGGEDSLIVMDVSDLQAPKRLGACRLPARARVIVVSGRFAYAATQEGGLRIVDVSNPRSPTEVGSYLPGVTARPGAAGKWGPVVDSVAVAGRYAFVTYNYVPKEKDAWSSLLQVLDISNPKAPVELGSFEADISGLFLDVALAGNYAYVADKEGRLHVIDVSDPKMPTRAGYCDSLGEPQGVFLAEKYAYVADDDGGMHVVDISDPKAPKMLGSFGAESKDDPAVGEAVAVAGGYAYVASDHDALFVVDVSEPNAPKKVALLKMKGPALGVAVANGYVYVNVSRGDLFIMRLQDKQRR